jgi:tubulin alpha
MLHGNREILSIHIGQCGLQTSARIWQQAARDNGIAETGFAEDIEAPMLYAHDYMYETTSGNFLPRALFIDTEPTVIENLQSSSAKKFFQCPNHIIKGREGAANNFARGYNMGAKKIHLEVCMKLQRELEKCDNCIGMYTYHSVGGGTGSGYATKFYEEVANTFGRKRTTITFMAKPSNAFSQTVEPINACLSLSQIHKASDIKFAYDNQSLYNLLVGTLGVQNPTFRDMNELIALLYSNLASAIKTDYDLPHIYSNAVPFPSINFLSVALLPLKLKNSSRAPQDIWNLTFDAFSTNQEMVNIDLTKGKYMACSILYRGETDVKKLFSSLCQIREQNAFVSWMPTGFKCSYVPHSYKCISEGILDDGQGRVSLSKISNHTAFGHVFEVMQERMNLMLSKRAYVHWYFDEGMVEQQFMDCNDVIGNIIQVYDDCIKVDEDQG